MRLPRRAALLAMPLLLPALSRPADAQVTPLTRAKGAALRCAVGPFQPTAGDTRRAYEPFFARLAAAVSRPLELRVTTDWAASR